MFADSALQRLTANLSHNKPLQAWVVLGVAVGVAYYAYTEYTSEDKQELRIWDAALAALSQSSLPGQLHGAEAGRVRLVKGKRLSGYTAATDSDVWHEVRMVEEASKEQQEKKEATADGRVLGLYKVRVTARREQPTLPPLIALVSDAKEQQPEVVEVDVNKASPEWHVDSILLSAPSRQASFWIEPATRAVKRAEEFIPPTALPSKAPASSSSNSPAGAGSAVSSSSALSRVTWSGALLAVCVAGATSLSAVYLLRYWRRQQLLSRIREAVQSSLSTPPAPIGRNAQVARVVSSKIGDAMFQAELDVAGDRPGTAGGGRVRVQGVRSSRGGQAGQLSDWQVVHSQLATNDGRTQQLAVPNIKS